MVRVKHRLRQSLGRFVHSLPLSNDFYGIYALNSAERVGTLAATAEQAIDRLQSSPYQYNVVAATKRHPETDDSDDGSYRRVDPNNPDQQWHIHVFERPDEQGGPVTEVFSHYEYRPLWPPSLRRSREHYWPDYGASYLQGQHCAMVSDLLETHGTYTGDPDRCGSASLAPPSTGDSR